MFRKIVISILSLLTVGFMTLTFQRMTMDYNENGVYFEGEVTYDTDALLACGTMTGLLLVLTIGTIFIWKNKSATEKD